VLLTDGDQLAPDDFLMVAPPAPARDRVVHLPATGLDLEALERDLVLQAIERTRGNQTHAATLLGMTRDQMRYRLEKLGLTGTRGLRPD
jgi:DNA-binding NtrC family response regulator